MVWTVICHICRSRMCMHVYTIIHRNTIFQMCSRKPKDPMEPKNRTISSTASSLVHQREHKHITYINLYNFNQIDVTVPVFQIAPSLHCRVVHCLPLPFSLIYKKILINNCIVSCRSDIWIYLQDSKKCSCNLWSHTESPWAPAESVAAQGRKRSHGSTWPHQLSKPLINLIYLIYLNLPYFTMSKHRSLHQLLFTCWSLRLGFWDETSMKLGWFGSALELSRTQI